MTRRDKYLAAMIVFAAALALLLFAPGNGRSIANDRVAIPATDKASDRLALSKEELAAAFQAAVADAKTAQASDITTRLFPIKPSNPGLIWRDSEPRRLRVASWVSGGKLAAAVSAAGDQVATPDTLDEARAMIGSTAGTPRGKNDQPRFFWITAVPQVRSFCQALGLEGDALDLRLKQYLGLDAGWRYDFFAEFWVDPAHVFRPCPDPEINDRVCELRDAQRGAFAPVLPPTAGGDGYRDWFDGTWQYSFVKGAAPWTQLGYTYDWGDSSDKVGASEYLIAADATFEIADVVPAARYCDPGN